MDFVKKLKTLRKNSVINQQEAVNKLYVSRNLFADSKSELVIPGKDILQKKTLLFDTGVKNLISCKETAFAIVEGYRTKRMLKNVTLIASFVIFTCLAAFYIIPLFLERSYNFPTLAGRDGRIVMRFMSLPFLLNK